MPRLGALQHICLTIVECILVRDIAYCDASSVDLLERSGKLARDYHELIVRSYGRKVSVCEQFCVTLVVPLMNCRALQNSLDSLSMTYHKVFLYISRA